MTHPINLATSLMATTVAVPRGIMSRPVAHQPALLIELYEMENCPYCRVVREVLTELDIDAMIYPCPKNGERYRPAVVEMGGKAQFPYLVDPNTDTRLYESAAIIRYLFDTYANRRAPSTLWLKAVNSTAAGVASALRGGTGLRVRKSVAPKAPLELWSFESSPFARLVRERLCELEIPYRLNNMGRTRLADFIVPSVRERLLPDFRHEGRNRAALFERAGAVQVPYLYDPNTGSGMFESDDIIDYLMKHYAA